MVLDAGRDHMGLKALENSGALVRMPQSTANSDSNAYIEMQKVQSAWSCRCAMLEMLSQRQLTAALLAS